MSTAAVAAARDVGCDVLTDTPRDHQVVATRDEETIYDTLLGRIDDTAERRPTVHELGDLVVATTFDLSNMQASDFAALSREREGLVDFRKLLAERAAQIPVVGNQAKRRAFAKEAAEEIVAQWEDKRRNWGRFLKRTLRLEAAEEAKDAATSMLETSMPFILGAAGSTATSALVAPAAAGTAAAGGLATAAGGVLLAAAPGLAVGFVFYGAKIWRDLGVEEKSAPTRFLSSVVANGGVLAAACATARRV